MKSVLVTGGSGAFGTAFAERLLKDNLSNRICLFSRGEHRQFLTSQELKPKDKYDRLRFMIGDVRDRDRLRRAMEDIDVVVHAAALKRIEVGHYNPLEMVKTNINGAINVIEAAHDAGVPKVVALSSDKAFQPVSPYGMSKALAESLFLAANNTSGKLGPKFSVCRYGNVWRSTGSVVPVWEKMRAEGDTVPVTSVDCTRFFMKMSGAVDLVLNTIRSMPTEVAIPELPAFRIGDLVEAMGVKYREIGLPAWEKMHESMSETNSSDKARRMTVDELVKALI